MTRTLRGLLLACCVLWPTFLLAQTPPPGTIEYYHVDAIGSVRAVTDASGTVVRTQHYHPFGEGVGAAAGADPMGYTGKPRDAETALDYFGARYYAQRQGRFTTVDPMLDIDAALAEPQRWNRYTYALNSPLNYVDPDGRNPRWVHRALQLPFLQRLLSSAPVRPVVRAAERLSDKLLDVSIRMLERQPVRSAYDIAADGGRHSGTLRNYSDRTAREIQRGIASYEKRVSEHLQKLSDPAAAVPAWAKLTPQEQQGLLSKWQNDLIRNAELANVLKGLLERLR